MSKQHKVILEIISSEWKQKNVAPGLEKEARVDEHEFTVVESTDLPHLIPGESFYVHRDNYPRGLFEHIGLPAKDVQIILIRSKQI